MFPVQKSRASRYGDPARVVGPGAPHQEAVIVTPLKPASWSYAESFVAEDDVLAAARSRAEEVGVVAIGSGGGAMLQFLASVLDARAVQRGRVGYFEP